MLYRHTLQKGLVLETIRTLYHATAQEVYEHIRHTYPSVSMGTVYRNLKHLCEIGKISCVRMPGGADYYDHMPTPHDHVRCRVCKRLFDSPAPYQAELDTLLGSGFKIEGHTLVFYGVCPDCNHYKGKEHD